MRREGREGGVEGSRVGGGEGEEEEEEDGDYEEGEACAYLL